MPPDKPSLSSYCPLLSPIWLLYIFDLVKHTFIYFMNFYIFYFSFLCINLIFVYSCSDVSKTTCSWQLTLSITWCRSIYWLTWSQLIQIGFLFSASGFMFSQWLYFPVDFNYVLIILLFSTLHFHSFYIPQLPSTWFFSVIFQFLTFAFELLLCCPSSSSSKTSFIKINPELNTKP